MCHFLRVSRSGLYDDKRIGMEGFTTSLFPSKTRSLLTSHDHQKQLEQYGMQRSMSRKRNCYNNACIESFHGILKKGSFISNNTQHMLTYSKIFGNTLKCSIIVKKFIQRMITYHRPKQNILTNLKLHNGMYLYLFY